MWLSHIPACFLGRLIWSIPFVHFSFKALILQALCARKISTNGIAPGLFDNFYGNL
jgi:hypothetical protein